MTNDPQDRASGFHPAPGLGLEALITAARSSDPAERWHAAGDENLPLEEMRRLAVDGDPNVLTSLAGNYGAPSDLLERLAADNPHLVPVVAHNPNAPVAMKEQLPMWQLTHLTLVRYGEQVGLTTEQVDQLRARMEDEPQYSLVTLGVVVRELGWRA